MTSITFATSAGEIFAVAGFSASVYMAVKYYFAEKEVIPEVKKINNNYLRDYLEKNTNHDFFDVVSIDIQLHKYGCDIFSVNTLKKILYMNKRFLSDNLTLTSNCTLIYGDSNTGTMLNNIYDQKENIKKIIPSFVELDNLPMFRYICGYSNLDFSKENVIIDFNRHGQKIVILDNIDVLMKRYGINTVINRIIKTKKRNDIMFIGIINIHSIKDKDTRIIISEILKSGIFELSGKIECMNHKQTSAYLKNLLESMNLWSKDDFVKPVVNRIFSKYKFCTKYLIHKIVCQAYINAYDEILEFSQIDDMVIRDYDIKEAVDIVYNREMMLNQYIDKIDSNDK